MSNTELFYSANAEQYFNNTFYLDMSSEQKKFADFLNEGDSILDAGCGSARDAEAFSQMGFTVTAFDGCPELTELARKKTNLDILCCKFLQYEAKHQSFDAIWASASLLHVEEVDLFDTMSHLLNFLKYGGIFQCSFKLGGRHTNDGNRSFTNMTPLKILELAFSLGVKVDTIRTIRSVKGDAQEEEWVVAVLVKQ